MFHGMILHGYKVKKSKQYWPPVVRQKCGLMLHVGALVTGPSTHPILRLI